MDPAAPRETKEAASKNGNAPRGNAHTGRATKELGAKLPSSLLGSFSSPAKVMPNAATNGDGFQAVVPAS